MGIRSILLKIPAPLAAGGIWFISSQSVLPQPKGILSWDKLQHFLAYGVLACASALWFSFDRWSRPGLAGRTGALLGSFGMSAGYGVIDEIHQSFVPGRNCNFFDWTADALGAALGLCLVLLFTAARRRVSP